jgi:pyrroline-5-carboxylate reductase
VIQNNLGFIGAGNMAEALIRGILETGVCNPENIVAADVNEIRLAHMAKFYGISTTPSNQALAQTCPILILAVKPQHAGEALAELAPELHPERHVLISIAAGLTTTYLEKALKKKIKVVRVMPNTPARLRAGATAFCLGQLSGEAETLLTRRIFEAVGTVVRVDEKQMNAVTALSGSGPAYVFKLCEMMTAAGMEMGLPAEESEQLSIQTILGAGRMLSECGQTAEALRIAVTSPAGTTEAALKTLASSDFEHVFKDALKAARDRGAALTPQEQDA